MGTSAAAVLSSPSAPRVSFRLSAVYSAAARSAPSAVMASGSSRRGVGADASVPRGYAEHPLARPSYASARQAGFPFQSGCRDLNSGPLVPQTLPAIWRRLARRGGKWLGRWAFGANPGEQPACFRDAVFRGLGTEWAPRKGRRLTSAAGLATRIAKVTSGSAPVAGVVRLPGSSQDEAPERDVDTRGTRLIPEQSAQREAF